MTVTTIRVKEDVRFERIHPSIGSAIDKARIVWERNGIDELWITSLSDGVHEVGSLHPLGCAVDFRKWNVPERLRAVVVQELRADLGSQYDVLESPLNFHAEWQPKGPPA